MGLTGAHLLVLLIPVVLVPVVVPAGVAVAVYFLVKKAVAAGVREGQRNPPLQEKGP